MENTFIFPMTIIGAGGKNEAVWKLLKILNFTSHISLPVFISIVQIIHVMELKMPPFVLYSYPCPFSLKVEKGIRCKDFSWVTVFLKLGDVCYINEKLHKSRSSIYEVKYPLTLRRWWYLFTNNTVLKKTLSD